MNNDVFSPLKMVNPFPFANWQKTGPKIETSNIQLKKMNDSPGPSVSCAIFGIKISPYKTQHIENKGREGA